jgi:hydrogenase expression/formation protein HypD
MPMKFIDEYRNPEMAEKLVEQIRRTSKKHIRLMEFCGGHTVAILKFGIRQALPPTIEMLSGPGCPVCVTAAQDLDRVIALARIPGLIITTFGDLIRVPGSTSSLQQARAEGGDVRIVYSALEAIDIALKNPACPVVFIGIGFETTAPGIAASILQAKQEGITNYQVLSLHKLTPPVVQALLESGETKLDGVICPGHVSSIIGSNPYLPLAQKYHIACVVSGFEPLDILQCIAVLVEQIEKGEPKVEIAYKRAVRPEGNLRALELMHQVFEEAPANWRGIGTVPASGLKIRKEYADFDAERVFEIKPEKSCEPAGCICGDILRGMNTPQDCRLFRKACTPERPVGPCMVSSEGTCAAYYHYGNTLFTINK